MFLFSFTIIALETIFFHMLLIVTNYLKATFVISIAMLGIAIGSFLGFYLLRFDVRNIFLISSLSFFFSIILSYYNITNIGYLRYPYYLILPFVFGAIIISMIFSKFNSNILYFTNLIGSALGVVFPILFIYLFKSENTLIILLAVPVLFLFILSFQYKNKILVLILNSISLLVIMCILIFLINNISLIHKINAFSFEHEIIPKLKDDYDRNFINRVYFKNYQKNYYELYGDKYDKKRAKYLLCSIGYKKFYDLNFDVIKHDSFNELYKIYNKKLRVILSEDSMLGRVELIGDDDYMMLAIDGVVLDGIDSLNGTYLDPRVPHLDDAKIFIIGLSADGIVKSAKKLKNSKTTGIEINPIIRRIMQEDGQFSKFAYYPYKNVAVYEGEGRSYLESTEDIFDMITLMNIHMEHGPISTLSPEYFHTVEGIRLLLNKISDRGYVVFEEILLNPRSEFAFLKLINTIKKAMNDLGIDDPEKNMHVFKWDFAPNGGAFRTMTIKRKAFTIEEEEKMNVYFEKIKESVYNYNAVLLYSPYRKTKSDLEKFIISKTPKYNDIYIPGNIISYTFVNDILKNIKDHDDLGFFIGNYYFNKNFNRYSLKELDKEEEARMISILDKSNYPYEIDLSPATDNKPFPFNIFKNKKEIKEILNIILIATSILLFLILLLIFSKYKEHRLTIFKQISFFSIIGFGYMLVEIVLMQKYQRFIGSPTFALIVILGGLLLFSGLGSFVSRKFSKKTLIMAISLIPIILLLKLLFLDELFVIFGKVGFRNKLIVSAALLFPLTFLMGMPFPNMLEYIKNKISGEYGTLMYGISGTFSTIAATASILISVTFGFTVSFITGIICYLIGILLFILINVPNSN